MDIPDPAAALVPGAAVPVRFTHPSGRTGLVTMTSRIDTRREAEWVRHGGVLPYVLDELAAAA